MGGRSAAGPPTKDHTGGQGIPGQGVGPMHPRGGALSGGKQPGNICCSARIGLDTTQDPMHARHDRQRRDIQTDTSHLIGRSLQIQESRANTLFVERTEIKRYAVSGGSERATQRVPERQIVCLKEGLSVRVTQHRPLTQGAFRGKGGPFTKPQGMVLHHLHISEAQPGSIGQAHAVAAARLRGRTRGIDTPAPARGQHDSGRTEHLKVACSKFQCEHPATESVLNNKGSRKPLFMAGNILPHTLLMKRVEHGVTGHIGRKCRAWEGMPAESPSVEFTFSIAVKRHSDMVKTNNVV